MIDTTTVRTTAGSLGVPGARLHYEVRGDGPLVVLVGSPMDARAFEALAGELATDHTVLTTDPRGIGRSFLDDPEQDSTPELRADDLARLITHLDAGPAVVFGSSGGAVTALALAQARPDLVHTVIAHEPPVQSLLPDAERRHAATDAIIATYVSDGPGAAWMAFLAAANLPMPQGDESAGPTPQSGERDPEEVATERRFFLHELRPTTRWQPAVDALRSGTTRIVVGIGADSAGQLCDLTSTALADALDVEPAIFPGDHVGFVADPAAAARRVRAVLGEV